MGAIETSAMAATMPPMPVTPLSSKMADTLRPVMGRQTPGLVQAKPDTKETANRPGRNAQRG